MKKIEFIWRHILYETVERRFTRFEQQKLAALFCMSSSTVNLSLAPLRKLGAVRVGGRGFEVVDYEKILYHWANHRDVAKDIAVQVRVNLPIATLEGELPSHATPTGYTAVRERFGEAPADYDTVYCYHPDPSVVMRRFEKFVSKGAPNLFVLRADPHLSRYGHTIPRAQLFVDLWNMTDWYAKDFVRRVKEDIDGLLS